MQQDKTFDFSILIIGLIVMLLLIGSNSCNDEQVQGREFKPVAVNYFNVGDTLYPDYAIPETLIVVDAKGLNYEVALREQDKNNDWGSDAEIANVFYKHCRVLCENDIDTPLPLNQLY